MLNVRVNTFTIGTASVSDIIGEMFTMIDLNLGLIVGCILGGSAAGIAWAVSELIMPRKYCPNCEAPYPKLYWPRNWRQGWRGGKTCKKCGCETDHLGRII